MSAKDRKTGSFIVTAKLFWYFCKIFYRNSCSVQKHVCSYLIGSKIITLIRIQRAQPAHARVVWRCCIIVHVVEYSKTCLLRFLVDTT